MNEFNFTTQDDDYITLYSKYILTGDFPFVKKEIEVLAENGHPYAIALWYTFMERDANEKIDNITLNLEILTHQNLFALSKYYYASDYTRKQFAEIRKTIEENENYIKGFRPVYTDEDMKEKYDIARYQFKNFPYYLSLSQATDKAFNTAQNSMSPIALYDLVRIYRVYANAQATTFDITSGQRMYNRLLRKSTKKLYKDYTKKLSSLNEQPLSAEAILYKFSLGNLLLMTNKEKLNEQGRVLLRELANREYSRSLKVLLGEKERVDKAKQEETENE